MLEGGGRTDGSGGIEMGMKWKQERFCLGVGGNGIWIMVKGRFSVFVFWSGNASEALLFNQLPSLQKRRNGNCDDEPWTLRNDLMFWFDLREKRSFFHVCLFPPFQFFN